MMNLVRHLCERANELMVCAHMFPTARPPGGSLDFSGIVLPLSLFTVSAFIVNEIPGCSSARSLKASNIHG